MIYTRQQNDMCDLFPKITIKHTVISQNDTCEAKFCSTLEGNMRKIKSYNFTKAEPYLQYLIPQKNRKRIWTNRNFSNIELPVIVTGASSNHYKEALDLLHNLKTVVFPVYKTDLVFFDLGLNPEQRLKIESICSCKVVNFPFDKFPIHVNYLFGYCWKPIIMQINTPLQSGFTRGDSTVNQILDIYTPFCGAPDEGKEVRAVFWDISKALDRVWHRGFIATIRIER